MVGPIRPHDAAVGEESVRRRTGRGREEWFRLLDDAGAPAWDHRTIARWLSDHHGVDPWWSQALTVGYEQARGMRVPGQRPDGTFEATASVTLPLPVDRAFAWCAEEALRVRWLGADPEVRGTTHGRSVRWTWADGRRVTVGLTALPPSSTGPRTRVAVTHHGLGDAASAAQHKGLWTGRLAALRQAAADDDG